MSEDMQLHHRKRSGELMRQVFTGLSRVSLMTAFLISIEDALAICSDAGIHYSITSAADIIDRDGSG